MKNKRKQDLELGVAAAIVMIYLIILTFAALDNRGSLAAWDTAVFVCLLYICWRSDREEKARLRRREAQRKALDEAMNDLEAWRKARSER